MKEKINFKVFEKILWCIFFIILFISTTHADILETSNHSYVFLNSISTGNVFDFYNYVESRPLDLYYLNFANYNILVYIIFGIWQLPIFIICSLFSISVNEIFLMYYSKILSVAFFIGCGYLIKKICLKLNMSESLSFTAALFFLFNPVAFFSPFILGQYDTFCLFFLLLSFVFYLDNDLKKFSIIMGVSFVFKFFSLLAFFPLLLLREKKLVNLLKYTLLSLCVYIPTTLLYFGKQNSGSAFTKMMFERTLTPSLTTSFEQVSIFLLSYSLILVFSYFYCKKENLNYLSVYITMAVYIFLFYGIYWHPQWVIILIPFIVISSFMQKNKVVYWYLDILLTFGFFMTCFIEFASQMGANILSNGLIVNASLYNSSWISLSELVFLRIPFFYDIIPLILTASLFANLIFKFPIKDTSLSDKISNPKEFDNFSYKTALYSIFIIGFIGFWLIPSILEYLNALSII